MTRQIQWWCLAVALAWSLAPRDAGAQGPTIDSGPTASPGSGNSIMGRSPGSGGGFFANNPGGGEPILGGRPGASTPRVPTTVSNPGAAGGVTDQQMGIAAPRPLPISRQPIYGSLSLPSEVIAEGPADGLTLDAAIDRLLLASLELRSKFMEIPQAQADILNAGLRANPIFYADGQLIPYGRYSRSRPGGQSQYDVNISYPLDLSHKRQSRTVVATRAKRVLEAQYQDAVRMAIDNLYTAYVDVLAARQTMIYSRKSFETLGQVQSVTQFLYDKDQATRADVNRVKIERESSYIGMLDAEESLKQRKRTLGVLLDLLPDDSEKIDLRGSIVDAAPPPPPSDELRQMALALRPDVVSFRLGLQRAEADVNLARANRFSDVYVLYQPYTFQDNSPFGLRSPTSWALGVTVPLPVYNRNQGGILRAKLNVTQTQIEVARLERQVVTEVQIAEKEYEITKRAIDRIEKELLPNALQVRNDTERLYKGGEVNVVAFLNAQRDYNDTVKVYLDTMVRHRRSMLALNTVLGQRVLP
jgi:cobalt-zinc-cadmium efflux system outer membrane protein